MAAHAVTGIFGAWGVGTLNGDAASAFAYLWSLSLMSSVLSGICFAVTNRYLSKHASGWVAMAVGVFCGVVSSAMIALALVGVSLPLAQFLAVFVPALLAVLLASLMEHPAPALR